MSTEFLLDEANWPLLLRLSHYKGTYSLRNIVIQLNKMKISINPAVLSQVYPKFGRVKRIRKSRKKDKSDQQWWIEPLEAEEVITKEMQEKIRHLMILSIHSKANLKLMTNDWLKSKNNLRGYNAQQLFHKHCKEMLICLAQLFVRRKTKIKRMIKNHLSFAQIQAFMRLRDNDVKSEKSKQIGQSAVLMSRLLILLCEHPEEDRTQLYDILSKEVNKQLVEQAFSDLIECFNFLDIIRKERQKVAEIEQSNEDKDIVKYLKYYYETERMIEPQQMVTQSEYWRLQISQLRSDNQNKVVNQSKFIAYDYAEAENKQRSVAKLIIQQIENKLNHQPQNILNCQLLPRHLYIQTTQPYAALILMSKQQLLDPQTWPILTTVIDKYKFDWKKICEQLKQHGIFTEPGSVRFVWKNIIHTIKPIQYPEESRELFILGVHYKASVPLMVKALQERHGFLRFESQVKFHFLQQIKQAMLQFVGIFIRKKSEKKTMIEKLTLNHYQAFLRLRDIDTQNEKVRCFHQSVIVICRLLVLFIQHYDEPRSSKYVLFSAEVNKQQVETAISDLIHCNSLLHRIRMHSDGRKMKTKYMKPYDPFLIDYLIHYEDPTENLTEYSNILQQHDNWRRQLIVTNQELIAPKKKTVSKFVVYDSENDKDLQKLSRKQIKLLNMFEEYAHQPLLMQ